MRKIITLLLLLNIIASVAWFNYQVFQKIHSPDPEQCRLEAHPKENSNWVAVSRLVNGNVIVQLLLKRI